MWFYIFWGLTGALFYGLLSEELALPTDTLRRPLMPTCINSHFLLQILQNLRNLRCFCYFPPVSLLFPPICTCVKLIRGIRASFLLKLKNFEFTGARLFWQLCHPLPCSLSTELVLFQFYILGWQENAFSCIKCIETDISNFSDENCF